MKFSEKSHFLFKEGLRARVDSKILAHVGGQAQEYADTHEVRVGSESRKYYLSILMTRRLTHPDA